jgi:aryl-phospho-beta-D-glucosidase BglC (GH1 family)
LAADKLKNDDTILAIDLKNEPHGKRGYTATAPSLMAKWDNSTDENNWKYAAEKCGKAILKANPNLLIVVEGLNNTLRLKKAIHSIHLMSGEQPVMTHPGMELGGAET